MRYFAKTVCTILVLVIFTAAVSLNISAAATGPYGAPDFTYEDYLKEVENYDGTLEECYILNIKGWNEVVEDTYRDETEIIHIYEGKPELNWTSFKITVDWLIEKREMDEYFDWYTGLPYSEQKRLLNKDAAIHEQMQKDADARAAAAAAAQAAKPITLKVNGKVVSTDSPPVIENGRTLAPVRAVVESLGYIAAWENSTKTIRIYDIYSEDLIIEMTIGEIYARVSAGSSDKYIFDDRAMDTPPKLINGRTMVPVRFIAETLGCKVKWDQATRTVSITKDAG